MTDPNNQDIYLLPKAPTFSPKETQWRNKAACKGVDTTTFFLERGATKQRTNEARAICNTCPVIKDCQEYALQFPQRLLAGIWGGLTAIERHKERQRRGFQD